MDSSYVQSLSADAFDEILRVPDPNLRACLIAPLVARLRVDDPWYATNVATVRVRRYLAVRPYDPTLCRHPTWRQAPGRVLFR